MTDTAVTVLAAGARSLTVALPTGEPGPPPTIEVIGHTHTGNETITRVLDELPDVALLDVGIADPDARAVCRRVREWAPATRVVAITDTDDELTYTTVVAGAAGAIGAGRSADDVASAIVGIGRGESLLLPRMATRLLHDIDAWARRSADPLNPPPTLTATEREVLQRLGDGLEPDAIAQMHAVTSHLVNLHAGYAVAKLHRYVLGAARITARR